jgi:integrase
MSASALLLVPASPLKAKPAKAGVGPKKTVIESQAPGSKLSVGKRMYLYTGLKGERTWKWMYRLYDPAKGRDSQFEVKLGTWPDMSYLDADAARAKAWSEFVDTGVHPPQHRTVQAKTRAADTKAAQAETVWHAVEAWLRENPDWVASYAAQVRMYTERYFGPRTDIGNTPYAKVTRNELVMHLRGIREGTVKIWDDSTGKHVAMNRGTPAVAKLCKIWVNAAFEQACDDGLLAVNPIANVRTRKKKSDPVTVHSPVMDHAALRKLLAGIRGYGGNRKTVLLLLLLAHTCVRSTELRAASWKEFDLPGALWVIPANRMKMKKVHKVPLSPQVITLLKQLQNVVGKTGLLFPNNNDDKRPMPITSAREALYRLTAHAYSPHSFRSTFSTLSNEAEVSEPHVIDAVLAHRAAAGNATSEGSYNQATYFAGRTKLMREWSDYLDVLLIGPARPEAP